MSVLGLDHVTIRVSDLARSRRFYAQALGLSDGARPPFDFPGAWLYAAGVARVHLVAGRPIAGPETGAFDHIAFQARDLPDTLARLARLGIAVTQRQVPGRGLHQVFLHDPDGIRIELTFAVDGGA